MAGCDHLPHDTCVAEGEHRQSEHVAQEREIPATVPCSVPVTTHIRGHLSELDVSSWCQE